MGYHYVNGYAEYDKSAAQLAAHAIAHLRLSLRAAAGHINLPYSSLLRWLTTSPNGEFATLIDTAASHRVFLLETELLTTTDPTRAKVLQRLLAKAAPEAHEPVRANLPPDQLRQPPKQINITVLRPASAITSPHSPQSDKHYTPMTPATHPAGSS